MVKDYNFKAKEATQGCIDWIKKYFVENGNENTRAVIGISGGKDSAVVAALCVAALGKDRVYGVKLPQGPYEGEKYANELIEHLGIRFAAIDIDSICNNCYEGLSYTFSDLEPQVTSNLPARIRMTMLYAIAAQIGGRVAATGNHSEKYIGYCTKYGDLAGDFAPIAEFTASEVIEIGRELNLPEHLLTRPPEDDLSGKTDEENFGFTYETLDNYLRKNKIPDVSVLKNIHDRHERNTHKNEIRVPYYLVSSGFLYNNDEEGLYYF